MMRFRLIRLVVLTVLVASCGSGTTEAASPVDGIQVHGDWTIEIYNADGSLDERLEFSNALGSIGARSIADVLGRAEAPGEWHVELNGVPDPCAAADGSGRTCRATEVADFAPNYFPTLVLDTSVDGVLTMRGSVVIQNDSDLSAVSTRLGTCSGTADSTACLNSGLAPASFSGKAITATPVQAGQTVQVQVDFSFTSG